jgi:hypothetical protein
MEGNLPYESETVGDRDTTNSPLVVLSVAGWDALSSGGKPVKGNAKRQGHGFVPSRSPRTVCPNVHRFVRLSFSRLFSTSQQCFFLITN